MLIYANKQDLISALPAEEIEELLCLGMINDRAWTIVACSAKEKEGKIFESFIGRRNSIMVFLLIEYQLCIDFLLAFVRK